MFQIVNIVKWKLHRLASLVKNYDYEHRTYHKILTISNHTIFKILQVRARYLKNK